MPSSIRPRRRSAGPGAGGGRGFVLAALVGSLLAPGAARADAALVDEGWRRFDEADFPGALAAFARARESSGLDRADLSRLLEGEAMAHLAEGNEAPLRRVLQQLASLDPNHRFDPRIRPEIVERFDATRARVEALAVRVQRAPEGSGSRVVATVTGDPGGLVQRVRLVVTGADGSPVTGVDEIELPASAGLVSIVAEAIGPGAVTVARVSREIADPAALSSSGGGSSRGPWLWVGIGGAAAVSAAVVTAIALSRRGDAGTRPGVPTFDGFDGS